MNNVDRAKLVKTLGDIILAEIAGSKTSFINVRLFVYDILRGPVDAETSFQEEEWIRIISIRSTQ